MAAVGTSYWLTTVHSFGNVVPDEGLTELKEMLIDSGKEKDDPTPSTNRSATKSTKMNPTAESEKLAFLKKQFKRI